MNVTASQIRQDLNCFGGFGQQGYGYSVSDLRQEIGVILGVNEDHAAILIGAGNLGRALAVHLDYGRYGCRLCGIFDNNEKLKGVTFGGVKVCPISDLESFCIMNKPVIAILCIPKDAAPEICEKLTELGVKAFWNFSHYDIPQKNLPGVTFENVHLGDSLMYLCYGVNDKRASDEKPEN